MEGLAALLLACSGRRLEEDGLVLLEDAGGGVATGGAMAAGWSLTSGGGASTDGHAWPDPRAEQNRLHRLTTSVDHADSDRADSGRAETRRRTDALAS